MKKTIILIAFAVWFVFTVTNAGADTILTFSDVYYVGQVIDGIPSSETLEAGYINNLITLAPGAQNQQIPPTTGEIYNRLNSTLVTSFPTATAPPLQKVADNLPDTGEDYTIIMSTTGYILGKYDASKPGAGAFVWYVPAGTYVVPGDAPGGFGLSHVTATVPEPGILILLGIAMTAVGVASHYVRKI